MMFSIAVCLIVMPVSITYRMCVCVCAYMCKPSLHLDLAFENRFHWLTGYLKIQ